MRLGIFGGTFDPVHIAHLLIAERVRETCRLDRVLFVPASSPPHKDDSRVSEFADRTRMIELAIADNPHFGSSSIESLRPGKSFTEDTLVEIGRVYPEADLSWIIGSDSACELHTWRNSDRLVAMAQFVVVARPGWSLDEVDPALRGSLLLVEMPGMNISATAIRERVRAGESIRYCVPDRVRAYIEEHGLYK